VKKISSRQNDEITSWHLAAYALSLLGGAHKKVHTEHIAEKCWKIAPDRFRWKHLNYPDKELVRKALYHAGEEKNGRLVVGRSGMEQSGKARDGYQLTPAGAKWIAENEEWLRAIANLPKTTVPKKEADRFRKRLINHAAFRLYKEAGSIAELSPYEFTDMLGCGLDAPKDTIRVIFQRLLSMANMLRDEEIIDFLGACEKRFRNLFGASDSAITNGQENDP